MWNIRVLVRVPQSTSIPLFSRAGRSQGWRHVGTFERRGDRLLAHLDQPWQVLQPAWRGADSDERRGVTAEPVEFAVELHGKVRRIARVAVTAAMVAESEGIQRRQDAARAGGGRRGPESPRDLRSNWPSADRLAASRVR